MLSGGKSNYENFLGCTSPHVSVHYYNTQAPPSVSSSSSSSSTVASGLVRRPRIGLTDVWYAYEQASCFAVGVPLLVENIGHHKMENLGHKVTTQYYVPLLSAIQIFTIKPFADDASQRSSAIGIDGTETSSDNLDYLYCQYNETIRPHERPPLNQKISELAKQHKGLNTLTSSDISPNSWISVYWNPTCQIPSMGSRKELSACFLTYHLLKPNFPETYGEDDQVDEEGVSIKREVVLAPFAAATYKAFGNVWIMPETSDNQNIKLLEDSASLWVGKRGFYHSDLSFFLSHKYHGMHR